ncbi:MAG TPA: DUF3566 domain-containing protein [Acidimicrobiales bacterium]|nr:DUF3566 domain-containing protein [Acidimicrobiales bacterium]
MAEVVPGQAGRSMTGRVGRAPEKPPGWESATSAMPRYSQGPGPVFPPDGRAAPTRVQPGMRAPAPPRGPAGAQRAPGPGPAGRTGYPPGPPGQNRPRPPGAVPAGGTRQPAPQQRGRRPQVVRDVHSRRVVRRIDVLSVAKVSLIFYLCVLVVLIVAGIVLWNVAAAFGVITSAEKLVRSLFALTTFKLHPLTALIWGSAIGAVLCLIGVFVNMLAASLYNLISDIVGGAQVFVISDKDA